MSSRHTDRGSSGGHRIAPALASAVVTMLLAVTVLAACGSGGAAQVEDAPSSTSRPIATAQAAASSVSVPIVVKGSSTAGAASGAAYPEPTVEVRVGDGRPVPVMLDTGSTGLQLFSSAVPSGAGSGVTVTTKPDHIGYAGGHVFKGVVADAVVTIGAQSTSAPVPFGLVESATCQATKPTCPTAGGMTEFIANGAYGIMGIGMLKGPNGLLSPILGMPGALGQAWSIHLAGRSGTLVLGAPRPSATAARATFHLRSGPTVDGHRTWLDDEVPVCVSVAGTSQCGDALLDTGTPSLQVKRGTADHPEHAGTKVTVSARGAATPFWSFSSDAARSASHVTLKAGKGSFVNLGAPPYFAFTVTYDQAAGSLTLT